MGRKALLVIDVQNFLVWGRPFDIDNVIINIKRLIKSCRDNGVEVIYIQHQNSQGLNQVSEGWQIYDEVKPLPGEKVIAKIFNSAFRDTELKSYLESRCITDLILTGMQTQYCFDTTCKVAFEYGYKVTVAEHTHTTFDDKENNLTGEQIYNFYTYAIFDGIFAVVKSCDEVINDLEA